MHKEEFVKETNIPELKEEQTDIELLSNIEKAKSNLQALYNNIKYIDNDLVDYYAYEVKAEQAKYGYLLKQAKKRDLRY
ncbi:MAG: DUF2508 family protein [Clostridia bacterium]|nr:DUF2508 family protein [Clostridia bacterium]